MGGTVGSINFAHDEHAIFASAVWIESDWLQNAVGTAARSLLSGGTVKAPIWEFFELREAGEVLELSLAAEVADGLIAVEPDVFEFVFGHGCRVRLGF
jgi:hypothetical protein